MRKDFNFLFDLGVENKKKIRDIFISWNRFSMTSVNQEIKGMSFIRSNIYNIDIMLNKRRILLIGSYLYIVIMFTSIIASNTKYIYIANIMLTLCTWCDQQGMPHTPCPMPHAHLHYINLYILCWSRDPIICSELIECIVHALCMNALILWSL